MIKFFRKYPEIISVMSGRDDGSMRLFTEGVLDKKYEKNRKKFFKKIGIDFDDVISAYLVHKTGIKNIKTISKKLSPKQTPLFPGKRIFFYLSPRPIAFLYYSMIRRQK